MKYKVGDKVRALQDLPRGGIPKGHILTISSVDENESPWLFCTEGSSPEFDTAWAWYKKEEHLFEKVENNLVADASQMLDSIYLNLAENYKLKETKHNNIMTNIKNYIKNLALTSDEKLLRKYNLKTECGEYTQVAQNIIIEKLCADNEAYLIEIAKGLDTEENGNK